MKAVEKKEKAKGAFLDISGSVDVEVQGKNHCRLSLRCIYMCFILRTLHIYIRSNYNTRIQIDSAYDWKTVDYLGTPVKCSITENEVQTGSIILMGKLKIL